MAIVRSALIAACALLASAAPATAETAPAALFDAPGQSHAIHCAALGGSPTPLRFSDATPTGFEVTDQFWFTDGRCPAGTVRLDLHEVIPSTAGPTVFHRGGKGYADGQNVKYGHLAASDLAAAPPEPVPASGGRGAPCELAGGGAFEVRVRSIPSEMKYKRPQDVVSGNNSGASFMHYGDPGADQGDRDDIHYSYLVWSFVDVRGGGMVRTLLAPAQIVRVCDVEPITMDAWDRQGEVNGQVTARYVQTYAGSCPVYGWMVWTHEYLADADGAVEHVAPADSPPPAPGAPDAACPVAPAASAPFVTTDGAAPVEGTAAWTLTGTANPKGVPTTFWFEYGVDGSYGAATPVAALVAAERVRPVSAPVDGLMPATTYHYRLVAASAHGMSYGANQTLTTAAPPPPPAPARIEPARVEPPSLSNLRVVPSAFKRTRSRRSSAARIRYAVSVAGTIKLTFLRAEPGMRAGSACRRPPNGGVPRGKRRCTRWVARGGALTTRVDAGAGQLHFGGWVGTRALPTGRYRLRAVPLDEEGRVGAARQASFRLR